MDEQSRKEAVAWFQSQLEHAQENLNLIDAGRLVMQRGDGPGTPLVDVTDEHRAKLVDTVERMKEYIKLYKKG